MKGVPQPQIARWLVLLAAMGFCFSAFGQQRFRRIEEPKWLTLRVTEIDFGAYAEGTYEETSFQGSSGSAVTHNHLFVGPSAGIEMEGSIYHPNLFRYLMKTDGSYGWAQETVKSGPITTERSHMEYLGRFLGTGHFLGNKPLNGDLNGSYDHSYRDYDFFNRVTVDSLRYGSRINYKHEKLTTSLSYAHQTETSSGLIGDMTTDEDTVSFQANHERAFGQTSFGYSYNQFQRGDIGSTSSGQDQSLTIADTERFGSRDQFNLNSGASYFKREFSQDPSDDYSARANLGVTHRENLSSTHDVNYDHYQSTTFTSDSYSGQSQLQHQLYESLSSTLIGQAADYEVSDQSNSGYTRRYGGGFAEGYTKRIGAHHRLGINNSLMFEHVDQQSISTVENERHTFTAGVGGSGLEAFFLNLPNVNDLTIVLRETDGTERLRGLDYDVVTIGPRLLIERLAGSRIPSGATVIVNYNADPTAAGTYDSLNEGFQIRFDLWENLWGLYTRANLFMNNAREDLRIQGLASYTYGTDFNWRWFRTGAEYEIYESDQASYNSTRLFQSFNFAPDPSSTLGVEFSESWTEYTDAHRSEENYRFITMYHYYFSSRFRVNVDGGIYMRSGESVEQTMATFRPGIDYVLGRTMIGIMYDYEYQLFLNSEERNKHLFTVRIARRF